MEPKTAIISMKPNVFIIQMEQEEPTESQNEVPVEVTGAVWSFIYNTSKGEIRKSK